MPDRLVEPARDDPVDLPGLRLRLLALGAALGLVLVADSLVMLVIPGARSAGVPHPVFWVSMAISLTVAFFVAWPVNRAQLLRGKGHAVTHPALGESAAMDNRPLTWGISAFVLGGLTASLGTLLG